jgi:hypothetical protein
MIKADANRQRSAPGDDWERPDHPGHAVREYLAVLDGAAFGAATPVVPKFISTAVRRHAGPAPTVGWRSSHTPTTTSSTASMRSSSMWRRRPR